ncbi:response regulator transcription factor [Lentzea sp. PSKA42]|uniref:Response regulator transcription factor n=1 Tax=Lentzea indica TaxID=2604800 RepID=A0ABX1FN63_9PSEU|nr:response regulator transcription factor [Lentzea indica]
MQVSEHAKVLVVEDDLEICHLIELVLAAAHLDVRAVGDGETALVVAQAWVPDVMLLDLDIPATDGFEVCRQLRTFSNAYVVMLTARTEDSDKVIGFSTGADDYLTKPFSPPELVARVHAMLRRPRDLVKTSPVRVEQALGLLEIDVDAHEVRVAGDRVLLTKIEFDLLATLTENVRQVLTRDQLRERVWGGSRRADDHTVDVHMSNLRRKISATGHGGMITTVRGVGYRFIPKSQVVHPLNDQQRTPGQRTPASKSRPRV